MRFASMLVLYAIASPALAQTPVPTPTSVPVAPSVPPSATPRLTLDTPIEAIVADAEGKKVLDANLPGIANHPMYGQFKTMSLSAIAGFAPDRMPAERMAKIGEALAAIK